MLYAYPSYGAEFGETMAALERSHDCLQSTIAGSIKQEHGFRQDDSVASLKIDVKMVQEDTA